MSQSEIMMIAQGHGDDGGLLGRPGDSGQYDRGHPRQHFANDHEHPKNRRSVSLRGWWPSFLVILFTLPWLMQVAMSFTLRMMEHAARVTG